jgi:hypothetical protein
MALPKRKELVHEAAKPQDRKARLDSTSRGGVRRYLGAEASMGKGDEVRK